MLFPSLQVTTTVSALVALLCARYFFKRGRPPLPPGPKGLPILGNIYDLPKHSPWLAFAEMGEKWGDLISFTTFGKTMIIVNSAKIAEDLLDSKGGNFSDRPVLQMGGGTERKLFHQLFGTSKAIERFLPLLRSEIGKLLHNLLLNSHVNREYPYRTTGAIVFRIAYGYRLVEGKGPFLETFDLRANIFTRSTQPAAFLVNFLPLPKAWAKILHESVDAPHEYVKQQMAAGTAENSFVSTLLHEQRDEEHLIKWAASAILAGGSSTTASQLEAFFLAMSVYPDVQAAAQRELDRVLGPDRLPDVSDRPNLPYMNAVCKEVLRWHNAAPTGKLLADTSLFLTCSMILAVFNITKVVHIRKNGVPVEPLLGQTTGTVSRPFPFECTVKPRSDEALALIRGI
ncbi:cytochrome P450 [Mycena leptocephala]|nr:cytochrome P450 [Mycena leptocephala]